MLEIVENRRKVRLGLITHRASENSGQRNRKQKSAWPRSDRPLGRRALRHSPPKAPSSVALPGISVFAFPIVGGKVNKERLSGRIVHSGGLAFTGGGERLVVRRFVIDLGRGVLTAEVAGAGVRVPLLRLGAPTGGVQVAPGLLVLRGVNARLSAPAAGALNQTFDTDLFEAGLPIGKATVIARTGS